MTTDAYPLIFSGSTWPARAGDRCRYVNPPTGIAGFYAPFARPVMVEFADGARHVTARGSAPPVTSRSGRAMLRSVNGRILRFIATAPCPVSLDHVAAVLKQPLENVRVAVGSWTAANVLVRVGARVGALVTVREALRHVAGVGGSTEERAP